MMRRLERNVGASHITLLRGYPGRLLCPEYSKALAASVLLEDVRFPPR
jgi:hypothetical protein